MVGGHLREAAISPRARACAWCASSSSLRATGRRVVRERRSGPADRRLLPCLSWLVRGGSEIVRPERGRHEKEDVLRGWGPGPDRLRDGGDRLDHCRPGSSRTSLDLYTGVVSSAQLGQLRRQGYEFARTSEAAGGIQADLVLTRSEVKKLAAQGIDVQPRRDNQGRTQKERAAAQAAGGFNVFRSYDEKDGIRDELYSLARRNSQIVKLEVIGHTLQGREIIALKVTKDARTMADGTQDVLYMSTIHAREWISTEVNRRLPNSSGE